jgi:integrase
MARRRAVGEGSVYFDASKDRWVGAVVVAGKRRKVLAKTKTEALKRLDAMRAREALGERTSDGNLTVAAILDRWQKRSVAGRDLAPSTVDTYGWCVDRLKVELGSRRIRALTVDAVETAFDQMVKGDRTHRPLSRSALIKVRSVLGQALDFGVRRGLVSRNVSRLAELTPDARRTATRRSLTAEQARVLLTALRDERLGALFTIMLTVGLRPGEAAGLTWSDVDLDAGRVQVRHGVRIERGRAVLVDALKTARSRRTIDLPGAAVEALRRHRHSQNKERMSGRRWADPRLVFASVTGTVLEPRNVARVLARVTEEVGLGRWTPNELRHSAASLLSAAGVPLEQVADLLGHTNTRMLENTYRHAVQPSMCAAVVPMDRLLGAS